MIILYIICINRQIIICIPGHNFNFKTIFQKFNHTSSQCDIRVRKIHKREVYKCVVLKIDV